MATKFTKKLGKSFLKELPDNLTEGHLKDAFKNAINTIPRRDLKRELTNDFQKHFRKLERIMASHGRKINKKPKSQSKGGLGDELVQSEKRALIEIGESEPQVTEKQDSKNEETFPFLGKVVELLKKPGTYQSIEETLQTLLDNSEPEVTKCLSSDKPNRSKHLAAKFKEVLSTCYLKLQINQLKEPGEHLLHLLSALLSIYLDLSCVFCVKKVEKKKKYGHEIGSYICSILGQNPETMLEVILQSSAVIKQNTKFINPFLIRCIFHQPSPANHQHYLKQVLSIQRVKDRFDEMTTGAELLVLGTKLSPLEGFHDWLQKSCPRSLQMITLKKEKSFRTSKITSHIIKHADEELVTLLLESLTADKSVGDLDNKKSRETSNTTEDELHNVQIEQQSDAVFFLDTGKATSDKTSKKSKPKKKKKKKISEQRITVEDSHNEDIDLEESDIEIAGKSDTDVSDIDIDEKDEGPIVDDSDAAGPTVDQSDVADICDMEYKDTSQSEDSFLSPKTKKSVQSAIKDALTTPRDAKKSRKSDRSSHSEEDTATPKRKKRESLSKDGETSSQKKKKSKMEIVEKSASENDEENKMDEGGDGQPDSVRELSVRPKIVSPKDKKRRKISGDKDCMNIGKVIDSVSDSNEMSDTEEKNRKSDQSSISENDVFTPPRKQKNSSDESRTLSSLKKKKQADDAQGVKPASLKKTKRLSETLDINVQKDTTTDKNLKEKFRENVNVNTSQVIQMETESFVIDSDSDASLSKDDIKVPESILMRKEPSKKQHVDKKSRTSDRSSISEDDLFSPKRKKKTSLSEVNKSASPNKRKSSEKMSKSVDVNVNGVDNLETATEYEQDSTKNSGEKLVGDTNIGMNIESVSFVIDSDSDSEHSLDVLGNKSTDNNSNKLQDTHQKNKNDDRTKIGEDDILTPPRKKSLSGEKKTLSSSKKKKADETSTMRKENQVKKKEQENDAAEEIADKLTNTATEVCIEVKRATPKEKKNFEGIVNNERICVIDSDSDVSLNERSVTDSKLFNNKSTKKDEVVEKASEIQKRSETQIIDSSESENEKESCDHSKINSPSFKQDASSKKLENKSIIIASDESEPEISELPDIEKHLKQDTVSAGSSDNLSQEDNKKTSEISNGENADNDSEGESANDTVIDTFKTSSESAVNNRVDIDGTSEELAGKSTENKSPKSTSQPEIMYIAKRLDVNAQDYEQNNDVTESGGDVTKSPTKSPRQTATKSPLISPTKYILRSTQKDPITSFEGSGIMDENNDNQQDKLVDEKKEEVKKEIPKCIDGVTDDADLGVKTSEGGPERKTRRSLRPRPPVTDTTPSQVRTEQTKKVDEPIENTDDKPEQTTARRSLRSKVLKIGDESELDAKEPNKKEVKSAKKPALEVPQVRETRRSTRGKPLTDTSGESDESESEPRHTRRSVHFKSQMEPIEENTEKRIEGKGTVKTPVSKLRPRGLSASTSKKVTTKALENKPSRKRRLSGEFAASDADTGGSGTDSEVSFPQLKNTAKVKMQKLTPIKTKTSPKQKTPRRTSLR